MEVSQQTLARMTRTSAEALSRAALELGDKISWRPLDRGRSALDQIVECGGFAGIGAHLFETGALPPMNPEAMEQMRRQYDTPEKALALLRDGAERFAQRIETATPDQLQQRVTLPFGGGMEKSLAEVALMNYWNTVYHEGQVNYIQTLVGDD